MKFNTIGELFLWLKKYNSCFLDRGSQGVCYKKGNKVYKIFIQFLDEEDYDFIEYDKDIDYMKTIIETLENGIFEIIDFFELKKLSKKIKLSELEDYTNLVIGFCRYLKIENPIIFGHSNGGRVTLSISGKGLMSAEKVVLFGSAGIKSKSTPAKTLKIAAFKTAKFFLTLPVIKNYTEELLNETRKFFGSSDWFPL